MNAATGTTRLAPATVACTATVFLAPALALNLRAGISMIELAILLAGIAYAPVLWRQRHALFESSGPIVLAFLLNLAIAFASLLATGFDARFIEGPLRAVLMLPAIGLVAMARPKADWFWYGLFAGAAGAAGIAIYQHFVLGWPRASGFHLSIMFGDIAMAMGLMALAGVQRFSRTRLAPLPLLTFVAGLAASILSGSRGGWVALLLSVVPLYSYGRHAVGRRIVAAALVGISLIVAAAFVPATGVPQRVKDIETDLQKYREGNVDTSLGLRLQMWKGSLVLFSEHPLAGVGRANFQRGLNELADRKVLAAPVRDYRHAHNELLNAFATEGLIGGMSLIFLYAAPLGFFLVCLRRKDASQPFALAGLLLVLSFIDFGLSQVMFAHHIGSAFYTVTVCMLAGLCIGMRRAHADAA